ncbi:MAG: arabinan endo 5-alpha-L-arabinosidase [Chloroflexi bacterium]|nr:arabinan endo 5-alpha-L-arabinosidase [Chloroflexota bacterium]
MLRSSISFRQRYWHIFCAVMLALTLFLAPAGLASADYKPDKVKNLTYTNPLLAKVPGDGVVESCADPSIIRSRNTGDNNWYIYCTTDPLNDEDRTGPDLNFHFMPILRSSDLVNWTYVGDVFTARPSWVAPNAGLWAPDIEYFNGKYYLYYTASDTSLPGGGSAIGVATAPTPTGPWTEHGSPVVEPHAADCCPGSKRWVYDPEVIEYGGKKYMFYGSYFGGISARQLTDDGFTSLPATQVQIAIDNKYEGANLYQHGGYWYLFVSATNCCNGPLTGYDVYVGRATSPFGPFVDRAGVSLLAGRAGGTPVITMNGNKWVGPGHNAVFQDFDGQDWTVYHAVDRFDPYFAGTNDFTKRPLLMDPIDWTRDGWPVLRGGFGPSDSPVPAPAAQPGQKTRYEPHFAKQDKPARLEKAFSDEFNSATLSDRWTWVRPPAAGTYGLEGGTFRFDTQAADLYKDSNNASVLTEMAPAGEYMVETKVKLNVPPEGCCHNFVQAGMVIYKDDNNFIKLVHVSIFNTRQTEFAKEIPAEPRYGNTVVGPPGEWTYLRIVKRITNTEEVYTPYTSLDGKLWEKGGAYTHNLGSNARIGLVSMGGSGFMANFDYVRVYKLNPRSSWDDNWDRNGDNNDD